MSSIAQVESNAAAQGAYDVNQSANAAKTEGKTKVKGRTIGQPELSEKGMKYYEELKKKYSNMDFILVSSDMKEMAKAQAGNYANANRTVVLIDEEKIERMAVDEDYRKQYEGIISNAKGQLAQLKNSLKSTNANVKTYGMQINDGGNASFFAVVDKSMKEQKKRIAKKAEDKKEAAKKADKKEKEKKAEEKKLQKADEKKKAETKEETETITASSVEELIQKINDFTFSSMSDYAQTEEEKMLGQHIDFRF